MKYLLIQLYQIGDVILTTHIPREIKKFDKNAEIDFLTFPMNVPVLKYNPNIREVLTISRDSGLKGMITTISKIRNKHYDAILDFHNNPRSAYITFLSGAKYKTGFANSPRRFFYNTKVNNMGGCPGREKLSLISPFEKNFVMSSHNARPEIFISNESSARIDSILKGLGITENDFFITMSPTHKRETRRWKLRHFMDTARYLVDQHNAKIMLTYGPGEKQYLDDVVNNLPDNIFIMPEMNLEDFITLVSKAKFHFGNDSAPHHIATSFTIPTFVIVGSTSCNVVFESHEHSYAQMGLPCQPCHQKQCRLSPLVTCMEELTFEMIKPKLEDFLNREVFERQ